MTNDLKAKFLNLLERAGTTFIEQFVVLMIPAYVAGATVTGGQSFAVAADTAGFAFIASVITSLATWSIPKLPDWADAILRVAKTGLQSFAGTLAGDQLTHSVVHANWLYALHLSVGVMGAAALKIIGALANDHLDGAALIPVATAQVNNSLDLDYGDVEHQAINLNDLVPEDQEEDAPEVPDVIAPGVVLPDHQETALGDQNVVTP